jgi:Fe-S-cluster containining protein
MSACDTCPVPGHCCRVVSLSFKPPLDAKTIAEAETALASKLDPLGYDLPFRPLFRRSDGIWVWWCPKLDRKTGRCGDYENRPYLCRRYEPRQDPLCILHPYYEHGPRAEAIDVSARS